METISKDVLSKAVEWFLSSDSTWVIILKVVALFGGAFLGWYIKRWLTNAAAKETFNKTQDERADDAASATKENRDVEHDALDAEEAVKKKK